MEFLARYSEDGVAESYVWTGDSFAPRPGEDPIDILIELPHGATQGSHFDDVRACLKGTFPIGLKDFFHVNTDIGSPECAHVVAERLANQSAIRSVVVVRSLLPRTFVDCNRTVQAIGVPASGAPVVAEAGDVKPMTPMLPSYIEEEDDRAWLLERYSRYQRLAELAYREVCGERGWALMLHTYAPRSVGIHVIDENIVRALHDAYRPEIYETWELRPEVDLIVSDEEQQPLADSNLVDALLEHYRRAGVTAGRDATYRLHPTTTGYHHAIRHPHRTLVVEVRRDLLAESFEPFREMSISPDKARRMGTPIAEAFLQRLSDD